MTNNAAEYLRYIASMLTDTAPIPTAGDRQMWRAAIEDAANKLDLDAPVAEMVEYVPPADVLLDQGVTRLQILAFLRGEHSVVWNGTDLQWVRYRAHQIDRETTPDGTTIRLMHIPHDGGLRAATFEAAPGSDEDAVVTLRIIDTIIDAAIAHHGPDGVA